MEETRYYKGYSLFDDIEDFYLRSHNRGAVLKNIIDKHDTGKSVPPIVLREVLEYLDLVPVEEQQQVSKELILLYKDK